MLLAWVDPREMEHLVAAVDQVLDEAASRGEVGQVVLVDERGDDQRSAPTGPAASARGTGSAPSPACAARRSPGSRRGPCRARTRTGSERAGSRGGDLMSSTSRRVPVTMLLPPVSIIALIARRVQQREVGGREGRHQVAGHEPQPVVGARVELGAVEQIVDRGRRGRVRLGERAESRVSAPGAVAVAPVRLPGLELRAAAQDRAPSRRRARRSGRPRSAAGGRLPAARRRLSRSASGRRAHPNAVDSSAASKATPGWSAIHALLLEGLGLDQGLGAHLRLAPGHARPDRGSARGRLGRVRSHALRHLRCARGKNQAIGRLSSFGRGGHAAGKGSRGQGSRKTWGTGAPAMSSCGRNLRLLAAPCVTLAGCLEQVPEWLAAPRARGSGAAWRTTGTPARRSGVTARCSMRPPRSSIERGYADASVQDIADELGILKGSLYHYIDTKEDLLFRLLSETHDDVHGILDEVAGEDGPRSARATPSLRAQAGRVQRRQPHEDVRLLPRRRAAQRRAPRGDLRPPPRARALGRGPDLRGAASRSSPTRTWTRRSPAGASSRRSSGRISGSGPVATAAPTSPRPARTSP